MQSGQVYFYKSIGGTPIFKFALKAWSAFYDDYVNSFTISNNTSAFVYFSNNVPISIILFEVENHAIKLCKSYTEEAFRRQGFHSILFEKLVDYARENSCSRILSTISPDNAPMLAAAHQQSRKIVRHVFEYTI